MLAKLKNLLMWFRNLGCDRVESRPSGTVVTFTMGNAAGVVHGRTTLVCTQCTDVVVADLERTPTGWRWRSADLFHTVRAVVRPVGWDVPSAMVDHCYAAEIGRSAAAAADRRGGRTES